MTRKIVKRSTFFYISTPGLECRNPGLNPGGRKLPGRQELRVAGRKLPGLKVADRMAGRRLPGAKEADRRLTGAREARGSSLPGSLSSQTDYPVDSTADARESQTALGFTPWRIFPHYRGGATIC